jgi:hypothetical protein
MYSIQCLDCRFWVNEAEDRMREPGVCRRYPPIQVFVKSSEDFAAPGLWPMTASMDWCGEFSSREF